MAIRVNVLKQALCALLCAWLFGCGALLGIEQLEPADEGDAAPAMSKAADDDGPSEADSAAGTEADPVDSDEDDSPASAAEMTGAAGEPDTESGEDMPGEEQEPTDDGMAGAPAGEEDGSAGDMDEEDPADEMMPEELSPISGRIIDMWGLPVQDALVQVGEESLTTGPDGSFKFEQVPPTYDVEFTYTAYRRGSVIQEVYGWIYVGLTRRDPTLQVFSSSMTNSQRLVAELVGTSVETLQEEDALVAYGCPSGNFSFTMNSLKVDHTGGDWAGYADSAECVVHALQVRNSDMGAPIFYSGYDSVPTSMTYGQPAAAVLDLGKSMPLTDTLIARLGGAGGQRDVSIHVRFDDNAALEVVDKYHEAGTEISYIVPKIDGSDVVLRVAAVNQDAAVVVDKVALGVSGLELDVPKVPLLTAPDQGLLNAPANVEFAWRAEQPVSVLYVRPPAFYEGLYVVTGDTKFKLRRVAEGAYALRQGEPLIWSVSHHGDFASVDEAAAEDGFISPAAPYALGARRGGGFHAVSYSRDLSIGN